MAIRSFVAIDTPAEIKLELRNLVEQLKRVAPLPVKWVKPEQMHLTLAFLGEVTPEFIEKAKTKLRDVARMREPFSGTLQGLGAFPKAEMARVLWVGMGEGKEGVKRLQAEVTGALTPIGYLPEKRAFTPHITLARLREPADAGFINNFTFKTAPFTINRFILFRSVLRPEGPEYSILGEFPFGNA